jgi:hypothetical protein
LRERWKEELLTAENAENSQRTQRKSTTEPQRKSIAKKTVLTGSLDKARNRVSQRSLAVLSDLCG